MSAATARRTRSSRGFVLRTLASLAAASSRIVEAEEIASLDRPLQRIDVRIKIVAALLMIVAVAVVRRPDVLGIAVLGVGMASVVAGGSSMRILVRQALLVGAITCLIALPALFLTAGEPIAQLPVAHLSVSRQGLRSATMLLLRVEASTSIVLLLVLTSRWSRILAALRWFHVPALVVSLLSLTVRYIVLLLRTTAEMFEARRSRIVAALPFRQRRSIATATAGVVLARSLQLAEEVHLAMRSRGQQ